MDQSYTGEDAEAAAAEHGMQLEVIRHAEAKKGFVLLPRRWVVDRSLAWMSRFRHLAYNCERLPTTFGALYYVAFAALMPSRFAKLIQSARTGSNECVAGDRAAGHTFSLGDRNAVAVLVATQRLRASS